jgi:hypothetical protein
MSYVWENSRLGGTELLCLLAISDFADDKGVAYPSVATLSKKLRMSERNTHYLLGKLVDSGELTIERNSGPHGCNLYRVPVVQSLHLQGLQEGGCKVSRGGATGSARGVQPIAPEPSLNLKTIYSEGFADFWKAYPRKDARQPASKAWEKLNPTPSLAKQIISAVEQKKTSEQWRRGIVPHASTFLNQRRWEDEAPAPKPVSIV